MMMKPSTLTFLAPSYSFSLYVAVSKKEFKKHLRDFFFPFFSEFYFHSITNKNFKIICTVPQEIMQ